jgi:hypothetical protein
LATIFVPEYNWGPSGINMSHRSQAYENDRDMEEQAADRVF